MITLEQITLEGYGSMVQKTIFPLRHIGLSILRGKVGSGKTTIPSSLSWVIFGNTLKKGSSIETWEDIRPKEYKGTFVRLDFTKEGSSFSIIRCLNYKSNVLPKVKGGSKLLVLKDGIQVYSERNKKDVQKYIQDLLGYSYDLFINSIVFGQRLKRIIEETGPNKKKIFDEAFETLFIDKARVATDDDRKKTRQALSDKDNSLENLGEQLDSVQSFYEDALEFERSFKSDKESNLIKLSNKIESLQEKAKEISIREKKIKVSDVDSLKADIDKLNKKVNKLDIFIEEINTAEREIKKLQDKKAKKIKNHTYIGDTGTCFTCGQKMNKGKAEELKIELEAEFNRIKKKVYKWEKSISDIDRKQIFSEKNSLNEELEKLKNKLASNKSNRNLKDELKNTLEDTQDKLESYEKEYKQTQKEKLVIKSTKYEIKKEKILKKIKRIKKEKRILSDKEEIQTWLMKDPLSNGGLKAYIFDSLLNKVNERLWKYSDIIGFRIEFGIDLETSNKDFYQMIYKDDMLINYPDLSGGQKQLVDTTVALAIHDIISSVRPINILFMDEPFEGLDKDTIEIVAEIISFKAKEQNLYLITHHDSFNPTNSNTIYFELSSKGQTIIS